MKIPSVQFPLSFRVFLVSYDNRDIKEGAGIYSTPTPLPQPIQLGGGMRHLKPDHIQIFDLQYARLVSE